MKIYISADMEGITGVSNWADVTPESREYHRFRKLMTHDVNAAIEGALEGGTSEVLVKDAHHEGRNILIEELHSQAQLIYGLGGPLCMMDGIDETFDAAFLIGYHAKAGTLEATLPHTFYGEEVEYIKLNGSLYGEIGISMLLAGYYEVPVVLVTGDDKACGEAKRMQENLEVAVTKKALDYSSAQCLSPSETSKIIKNAAKKAVERVNSFQPYKISSPFEFEVKFGLTSMASLATLIPAVDRIGPRTITVRAEDLIKGWKTVWAATQLGVQAK